MRANQRFQATVLALRARARLNRGVRPLILGYLILNEYDLYKQQDTHND
jgi:hypothetical protein